jgi:hypothetical protein
MPELGEIARGHVHYPQTGQADEHHAGVQHRPDQAILFGRQKLGVDVQQIQKPDRHASIRDDGGFDALADDDTHEQGLKIAPRCVHPGVAAGKTTHSWV